MVLHLVAMRSYRSSRTFAPVIVSLSLVSCATTVFSPIGAGEKPFQMEEDEAHVWRHAEQIERQINKSGSLYEDDQLEAYINAVAQKLVSSQVQALGLTPRVRVIKHPLLNAFALPNRMVYLHTGMLARMENETQLATVLGHEMTHFLHRHTVKEMRSARNKVAFLRVLQIMLAAGAASYGAGQFGQIVGDLTGQIGAVWALASVRGYSRDLETGADEERFKAIESSNPQDSKMAQLGQACRFHHPTPAVVPFKPDRNSGWDDVERYRKAYPVALVRRDRRVAVPTVLCLFVSSFSVGYGRCSPETGNIAIHCRDTRVLPAPLGRRRKEYLCDYISYGS